MLRGLLFLALAGSAIVLGALRIYEIWAYREGNVVSRRPQSPDPSWGPWQLALWRHSRPIRLYGLAILLVALAISAFGPISSN